MKKHLSLLLIAAMAIGFTGLVGCKGDKEMGEDVKENPALKDMPPVPPEAAKMGDGPGGGGGEPQNLGKRPR